MKIAHVLDSVEVGGAEIMMATLARLQRAAGHRISVHCFYEGGGLVESLDVLQEALSGAGEAAASARHGA